MEHPTHPGTIDPADLATTAVALVREQAPETRLLPIAARPVADHPEYQQVNRIGRDGVALKRGWTFLVKHHHPHRATYRRRPGRPRFRGRDAARHAGLTRTARIWRPVARVTNGVYAVTGYEELIALAHDPRVSSDIRRSPLGARPREITDPSTAEMIERYGQDNSFIMQDPPDHDRTRRSCMPYFGLPHAQDVIPSQEPLCQQIVNALLDKAIGKTRIDVVDEFAYPFPVQMICRILDVPLEDEPRFHAWIADAMARIFDLGPEIETEEGQVRRAKGVEAGDQLKKYVIGLVERAKKSPCPGMISQLVDDHGPEGPMSPSEIVNNTILPFVAGHDSKVNLISHSILTVLRNPGPSSCYAADPG